MYMLRHAVGSVRTADVSAFLHFQFRAESRLASRSRTVIANAMVGLARRSQYLHKRAVAKSDDSDERVVAMSDFGRHRSRQMLYIESGGVCDKMPVAKMYVISSNIRCHLLSDTNVNNSEILQRRFENHHDHRNHGSRIPLRRDPAAGS